MNTLIIPCGGKSTRFPGMRPKWLLTHPDGKLMIENAIKGIDLAYFDRIIITIIKEHDLKYDATLILNQCFNNQKFEILVLDEFTSCAAETVYQTIIKKNIVGSFMVKDSDNFTQVDYDYHDFNFIVGFDLTKENDIARLAAKSFLIVNEQGQIIDIIEKQIKSNIICLGVYGFDSAKRFTEAYEFILANKLIKGEVFISHIISYIIGSEETYYIYVEANDFEDWGTIQDWKRVKNRFKTYFIDVDGVMIKNSGKYGIVNWSNNKQFIDENVQLVKKINESGGQIIFTTSRGEEYREFLTELFTSENIKYHALVMGCFHSTRVIINDFASTNAYPSCVSVNLPRNGMLSDYLDFND